MPLYQFPKQSVRCVLMYLFKKGKEKNWKGLDEFLMDLRPEFMTARSLEFKKTRARGSRWRLSVINRVPTPERACFSHTTPANRLGLRFA